MSLTLGLTGMDPATEAALKAAFADANTRLGGAWELVGEADAAHVLVDMDSMYGPMSWLRLHAAGKRVIGLTTAPRTQTDFRLGRPFDTDALAALLREVAGDAGVELDAPRAPKASSQKHERPAPEVPPPAPPAEVAPVQAVDAARAPAPTTTRDPTPAVRVDAVVEALADPDMTPAPTPQHTLAEDTSSGTLPEAILDTLPTPVAEPPLAPRERTLIDWLAPGALTRRVRYGRNSGPSLLFDPSSDTYHGPGTLKPLAGYFVGTVDDADFDTVPDDAWPRESASAGTAQPVSRLRWLHGLVAGQGRLLPGYDPAGRYRLTKWPQTEREYPRHFRIATAMMKGPATLAEITESSAMSAEDVADFINANLATGFAEFVPEPQPEPAQAPRPTGLLGRLRGR